MTLPLGICRCANLQGCDLADTCARFLDRPDIGVPPCVDLSYHEKPCIYYWPTEKP